MGGTLRRLVEQKHEVHVAYETSGNIAVGDEEVVRFMPVSYTHLDVYKRQLTDRCFQKRIEAPMFQPCVSYSAMNFNSRQKEGV